MARFFQLACLSLFVLTALGCESEIQSEPQEIAVELPTKTKLDEQSAAFACPDGKQTLPPPYVKFEKKEAGETFSDCYNCPEMIVLPAGKFIMGAPEDEEGRGKHEEMPTEVKIAQSFAVGRFEVTRAQWEDCVSDDGCKNIERFVDFQKKWAESNLPVHSVSWNDAVDYTNWLTKKTGFYYRLLTGAEWEYAARAGTQTPFSTGETITPTQANFDGDLSHKNAPTDMDRQRPLPVGSFEPNGFGLFDMHGNVSEYVQDWHPTSLPAYLPVWKAALGMHNRDPTSFMCRNKVTRGGGWISRLSYVRSASIDLRSLDGGNTYSGFRIAREVTE